MNIEEVNQNTLGNLQSLMQNAFLNAAILNPSKIEEKHEKNLEKSKPILSNVLTPYEAFKGGFEQAIASYIKLGQEAQVKKKPVSQKQTKSEETQLLESLIKNLLKDFDSVKFIKKDNRYLAISNGKLYQFSTLLERVNFNQIELTSKELEAYHKLLDSGRLFQKPYLSSSGGRPTEKDFNKHDPDKLCKSLSFAEKEAINIYTGNFYQAMNKLMRGNIDQAIEYNYIPEMLTPKAKANHSIKETLLHIAVAVSGLNKLPDYVPLLDLMASLKNLFTVQKEVTRGCA